MNRLYFEVPPPDHGLRLSEAAEATLAQGVRGSYLETHARLLAFHEVYHSRNRPPDLDCTGCRIWPVIKRLRVALTVPGA